MDSDTEMEGAVGSRGPVTRFQNRRDAVGAGIGVVAESNLAAGAWMYEVALGMCPRGIIWSSG